MLKKTLIAAAVSTIVASPAMALTLNVTTGAGATFEANTLAVQTKQEVLDKTSLDAKVIATFNNTVALTENDELKAGGEVILNLTGQGQFNTDKVVDLLETSTGSFPGITVTVANDAAGTIKKEFTDTADLGKLFKIDTVAGTDSIRYTLDQDNQRLSLRLNEDLSGTFDLDGGTTVIAADAAYITVTFDFNQDPMKQGFKLVSGSKSTVSMNVGALQNASYTANPVTTPVLFKTEDLFTLKQDVLAGTADATALVAETYTQWDQGAVAGIRAVKLWNASTLQNIQTGELKLSLTGDFTGISQKDGYLADAAGAATKWSVANGVAAVTYSALTSDVTIPGTLNSAVYNGYDLLLPSFVIAADNADSLEAQKFELKAEITAGSFTYVPYEYKIGDAFVVVRDGMKFDTVTTGTSAQNVIYIRDVSKTLPADGGKIFVTITEYDAHELENGGKGTDLVTRAVLPTRLPSNGAVTLTPAGIAEALGVATAPGHQARFYFEVETNEGEAAVKKQTSDGVDIQTGSIANVNFTL
ncbi:VapA family S-layer protein [Vibrio fluvialis]|uniref:VapA family S-layer protein n=1 Tax=Vibrio fluvialis TaxID=676 RepID=UPI003D7EC61A